MRHAYVGAVGATLKTVREMVGKGELQGSGERT